MDDITFKDIASWVADHLVAIILVLSVFFEISKIKLNPISWVMKLLLKPMKKDIDDVKSELKTDISNMKKEISAEIDAIKENISSEHKRIDELIASTELSEISRIRWNILEFASSIDNNQKHIRDEYRHIKDEADRYHALTQKYNIKNGLTDESMEKINKKYEENKSSSAVYF